MTPDFEKLPDRNPRDPHQTGIRLIYVLMAVLAALWIIGFVSRN